LASRDGIDGVSIHLFKLRANLPKRKIWLFFSCLNRSLKFLAPVNSHAKVAIRLFLEWRFAHFLCGAQEMSRCPKNEYLARSGKMDTVFPHDKRGARLRADHAPNDKPKAR
jgi:hypothetical protein